MTVPLRTEKRLRQSRQRNGIVLCLAPDWTRWEPAPQCGHYRPCGRQTRIHHCSAAASCGNMRMAWIMPMPLRVLLPRAFLLAIPPHHCTRLCPSSSIVTMFIFIYLRYNHTGQTGCILGTIPHNPQKKAAVVMSAALSVSGDHLRDHLLRNSTAPAVERIVFVAFDEFEFATVRSSRPALPCKGPARASARSPHEYPSLLSHPRSLRVRRLRRGHALTHPSTQVESALLPTFVIHGEPTLQIPLADRMEGAWRARCQHCRAH